MAEDLRNWNPEDERQWLSEGKTIANRNLWLSIPALLCGFAVWLYWGIITVQMLNLGFAFSAPDLFSLTAIAGLSGATLRIPSAFLVRLAGGRNTIFLTTLLLILPALGTGIALQDPDTPLWRFQLLALLSGLGGGNFASSMSNISFFFPKRVQGYSLGLNAGLGNFGVTAMQILTPLVMTMAIFGGEPMILHNASGTLIGKIEAGGENWIQNAGYIWLCFLVPLAFATWIGMNNIVDDHVSPDIGSTAAAFLKIIVMLATGLVIVAGDLFLILPQEANGLGLEFNQWVMLPLVIAATVFALKALPLGTGYKQGLALQYRIFANKHSWAMAVIYTMVFGSFIGYSAALGLSIKVIFGFRHLMVDGVMTHDTINPDGPSALMFAWIGPFIYALIRPLGGKIADKMGGAKVTQIVSAIMVVATLGAAYFMKVAYASATPEQFFPPFLILFLILFTAAGLGSGSAFRTIATVFDKGQAGPALGWASAVAAYSAYIIPEVFGEQIRARTPEIALYGFAAFYAACIVLNWWFYLRENAYVKNP
ncbi:MAG: antiporter [Hyphomicrobiales bacterium]